MKYLLNWRKHGKFIKIISCSEDYALFYMDDDGNCSYDKKKNHFPSTAAIVSNDELKIGDYFTYIYIDTKSGIAKCENIRNGDYLYVDDNYKKHWIPYKWAYKIEVMPGDLNVDILDKIISGSLKDGDRI